MPQRILGIDIGSYSVKVAVIERSFKSFSFVEFYERRVQYNEVLSPEESKAIAVQGLIDDHNLTWDVVCSTFPAQRATTRLLTFPFTSIKKIDQTVEYEIESYIPFDLETMLLDYIVAWQTKDASRVMVVYVQKGELAKELSMLETVGVDPRFVCIEGIELSNLVNLGMVPPEGAYAVIDIGHEKSVVTICRGRRLGYIRAIAIAGKAITAAIAARLKVPLEEAEKLKIEVGNLPAGDEVIDDTSREVIAAIRGVLDELLLHIRQTLFTFQDTEGAPIEGIYLCGGTSRMPGFDRYLSDTLKLNVSYLNCADFHFTQLDRADAHRHVIPQALALALRGVGGTSEINLRRGEFAFKGDVEELGGSMRHVGVVAGLVIFLALVSFISNYYSVKRQIDRMKNDVVALVRQVLPGTPTRSIATPKAATALIKSREAELNERINQLKAAMGMSPLNILKAISAGLPARDQLKVEVDDINIAANRISISGVVDDFKTVDTVKQSLEKSTLFTNITTGNVSKGVKGEVKFKLSMEVAGAEKEE